MLPELIRREGNDPQRYTISRRGKKQSGTGGGERERGHGGSPSKRPPTSASWSEQEHEEEEEDEGEEEEGMDSLAGPPVTAQHVESAMEGVELDGTDDVDRGGGRGPVGGEWSPESQSCGDHDYFEDNPSTGFGVELEVEHSSSHATSAAGEQLLDTSVHHYRHHQHHRHSHPLRNGKRKFLLRRLIK